MRLFNIIQNYKPKNQQEEYDKEQMLQFVKNNENYLERENQMGHFTASMWTVNKERTKTLMVYHNLYDSWSWIGGHADGMENLCEVALKNVSISFLNLNALPSSTDTIVGPEPLKYVANEPFS